MRARQPACPIDYTKICNQTVTVYHKSGDEIIRTVHKAFLELRKTQSVNKTARKAESAFLLVIPGSEQAVFVGDKIYVGDGPKISAAKWSAFNPNEVPQLAVVGSAEPKYYNGEMVHTEAGDEGKSKTGDSYRK